MDPFNRTAAPAEIKLRPSQDGSGSGIRRQGTGNSAMFMILELNIANSAAPTQVGGGFATREDALMAVKRYLKSFKVSGHNSEESYWWARDSDGLRRCWISPA
jgi:hypothetical protein